MNLSKFLKDTNKSIQKVGEKFFLNEDKWILIKTRTGKDCVLGLKLEGQTDAT